MEHPCSLKGLACTAVLNLNILIPPKEIPVTLQEDLRHVYLIAKLKKEEFELEKKMSNVETRLEHATFQKLLYENLIIDSPSDEEVWISYLQKRVLRFSRIEAWCLRAKAKLTKEQNRRDDEEEENLQKLEDKISQELHMLVNYVNK